MTCTTRPLTVFSAATALTLLLLWAVPTPAGATPAVADAEAGFLVAINSSRAAEGLDPLVVNQELAGIARAWSGEMDVADQMSHSPHYSAQYSGDWSRMGENVGFATWPGGVTDEVVAMLHQAFMDSPGHRANIMGAYNQVGIGVVIGGDTTWVTVNFLQGDLVAAAEDPLGLAPVPPEVIVVPDLPAPQPAHYVRTR